MNRLLGASLMMIGILLAAAISAPWLAPYDPLMQNLAGALDPPSWRHLFGADELGRDIFSRILYGTRVVFLVVIWSAAIPLCIGVPMGVIAGFNEKAGRVINFASETLLPFPELLLAILITSLLGPGLDHALLALSVVFTPINVRLIRSEVIRVRRSQFVLRLEAAGISPVRIMSRHLGLHVIGAVLVQSGFNIASGIVATAGLSYLGLGQQPPQPEWGLMLASSTVYFPRHPALFLASTVAIIFASLAFGLMSESLRGLFASDRESTWNPFLRSGI